MLRNMLGPVFNFNLDQFLTLDSFRFLLKPLFLLFSAKMQNLKKHKKKHYLWTHLC